MKLWIRSQDRHNLLKIDRLDVDDCTIQANFKAYNDGCDYIIIGRYKTNKRALEVLDEIQKFISIDINGKNINYENADLILKGKIVENSNKIYTMPKE